MAESATPEVDDPRAVVTLHHQVEYQVTPAWIRDRMGDHTSPLDDVVRAYIAGVEDGDLALPEGRVEFAMLEFDVEIPAQTPGHAAA